MVTSAFCASRMDACARLSHTSRTPTAIDVAAGWGTPSPRRSMGGRTSPSRDSSVCRQVVVVQDLIEREWTTIRQRDVQPRLRERHLHGPAIDALDLFQGMVAEARRVLQHQLELTALFDDGGLP